MTLSPFLLRHPLRRHPAATWALTFIGALAAVAAAAALISFATGGKSAPSNRPLDQQLPGVLLWEDRSGSSHATTPRGAPLQRPTTSESPSHLPNADGIYPGPDGAEAVVRREADGVYLDIVRGVIRRPIADLAGFGDPEMIAAGKGPARAVAGIPLVVSWSPDGRSLAYGSITGEPWTLHVASTLSGSDSSFAVSGGYIGELAWSPDGRFLAVSTYQVDRRDHTVFILERDNWRLRQLIDGCHLNWSPDGRYLFVHRDPNFQPGAWVVAADGPERWAISNDPEAYPIAWNAS